MSNISNNPLLDDTDLIEESLYKKLGDLSDLEQEVVDSLRSGDILAENTEEEIEQKTTFGERVADKIAEFGGSWKFILLFISLLAIWMIVNVFYYHEHGFDPYPFILLNLALLSFIEKCAPIFKRNTQSVAFKEDGSVVTE